MGGGENEHFRLATASRKKRERKALGFGFWLLAEKVREKLVIVGKNSRGEEGARVAVLS